jgi:hypothetical protein
MARGETPNDLSSQVVVPVGAVARVLGWTRNRTKRWLAKEGMLRKQSGGKYGQVYTTRALIRRAFPEDADHIIAGLEDA